MPPRWWNTRRREQKPDWRLLLWTILPHALSNRGQGLAFCALTIRTTRRRCPRRPLTLEDQVRLRRPNYDFTRDDANCFVDPRGRPLQMAMRLTRRVRPSETLSVICKDIAGDLFWFIEDLRDAPFDAGAYIAAVQRRVERNRVLRQGCP